MTLDYTSKALHAVEQEDWEAGGDYYTQGAYQCLAHDAIRRGSDQQIGAGLDALLRAALSYRRAGSLERCQNRCTQGVLYPKI